MYGATAMIIENEYLNFINIVFLDSHVNALKLFISANCKSHLLHHISPSEKSRSSTGKSPTVTLAGFTNPPYFA